MPRSEFPFPATETRIMENIRTARRLLCKAALMRKALFIAPMFAAGLLAGEATAAPLTQAKVNRIINDVRVTEASKESRPAKVHDVIRDQVGVVTGVKSRSELLFEDDTLTRLGSETSFSFKSGTRDLSLERGSMLLQVPKGLGGATIRTAAVTAAITGTTIMMEYVPKQRVKVIVLEGSLRLGLNAGSHRQVVLRPGQMVLMTPDAKKIPKPVTIDLAKLVHTSALVTMKTKGKVAELPSIALIEHAIQVQEAAKARELLVTTNTQISGSNVVDSVSNHRDTANTTTTVTSATVSVTPDGTAVTPPPADSTGDVPPATTTPPTADAIHGHSDSDKGGNDKGGDKNGSDKDKKDGDKKNGGGDGIHAPVARHGFGDRGSSGLRGLETGVQGQGEIASHDFASPRSR